MTLGAHDVPSSRPHGRHRRLIERHFRGRGAPAAERELRAHLVSCADCRDLYDRHLRLAAVDPSAAVSMEERLARGLDLPQRPAATPRWWLGTVPAALGLAVVLLAGRHRTPPLSAEPPQARGTLSSPGSQLLVYEVSKRGEGRSLTGRLPPETALAFAYANIGHKRRLLVFAVDERRRVYWYHPSWTDAREDPVAVPVRQDDAMHELPERITHRFQGHHLTLYGVFLDAALSVRQVEASVARAATDANGHLRLSVPDADVVRFQVDVDGHSDGAP